MSDLGNKAIMAQNIQRLMEQAGKSRTQVCDDLGIKYTTFTDWVNAKTYPRIDKIELMANYFGVSKADLVESCLEDERQKKLERLEKEIREGVRALKTTVDSIYNFYSSLGSLVGLSEMIPRDIVLKPQQGKTIERDIKLLVEKFLATATPEETEDFWSQYDKIGQELRYRINHPAETPYPSQEELETYGELAGDFLRAVFPTAEDLQDTPTLQKANTIPSPEDEREES